MVHLAAISVCFVYYFPLRNSVFCSDTGSRNVLNMKSVRAVIENCKKELAELLLMAGTLIL